MGIRAGWPAIVLCIMGAPAPFSTRCRSFSALRSVRLAWQVISPYEPPSIYSKIGRGSRRRAAASKLPRCQAKGGLALYLSAVTAASGIRAAALLSLELSFMTLYSGGTAPALTGSRLPSLTSYSKHQDHPTGQ